MEGDLVGKKPTKPKSIPIPVPGAKPEDDDQVKRGRGRPPGSSSSKKKDDGEDSLALLMKAGIDMLATMRAQQKGPHWLSVTQQSEEIARLTSKVIDKWFPMSKVTKYADEVRLLVLIGQTVGTPMLIDFMMAKTEEPPADQQKGGNEDAGERRSGPAPVRDIRSQAERAKPNAGADVKRSGPAVI